MPRLFFAMETPVTIKTELIQLQVSLEKQFRGLNPIPNYKPERLQNSHCTIRFLGNVEESKIEGMGNAVREAVRQAKLHPFEYTLSTCGVYPNQKQARVFWVGLTPEEPFEHIQRAIDEGLNKAKIPFEAEHSFHPHLTLFRFRERYRFPRDFVFPDFSSHSFGAACSEAVLVESKTLPEGPVHTIIQKFLLG